MGASQSSDSGGATSSPAVASHHDYRTAPITSPLVSTKRKEVFNLLYDTLTQCPKELVEIIVSYLPFSIEVRWRKRVVTCARVLTSL
jgi:hypothetical protein